MCRLALENVEVSFWGEHSGDAGSPGKSFPDLATGLCTGIPGERASITFKEVVWVHPTHQVPHQW